MYKPLLALIGCAALTTFASAQTQTTVILGDNDSQFLKTAAEADMAEVAACKLVLAKTDDSTVKRACRMMITDHTHNLADVKRLATRYSVDLPGGANDDHMTIFNRLQGETGTDMDKDFVAAQLNDHKNALGLFQDESESTTAPTRVTAFATRTLPALRRHWNMWTMCAQKLGVPIPDLPTSISMGQSVATPDWLDLGLGPMGKGGG